MQACKQRMRDRRACADEGGCAKHETLWGLLGEEGGCWQGIKSSQNSEQGASRASSWLGQACVHAHKRAHACACKGMCTRTHARIHTHKHAIMCNHARARTRSCTSLMHVALSKSALRPASNAPASAPAAGMAPAAAAAALRLVGGADGVSPAAPPRSSNPSRDLRRAGRRQWNHPHNLHVPTETLPTDHIPTDHTHIQTLMPYEMLAYGPLLKKSCPHIACAQNACLTFLLLEQLSNNLHPLICCKQLHQSTTTVSTRAHTHTRHCLQSALVHEQVHPHNHPGMGEWPKRELSCEGTPSAGLG